jgi:glutamate 5-kinase
MKIVIKVGTSSLTDKNGFLNEKFMDEFVESIANLKNEDWEIVLVSSGAITAGLSALNIKTKPQSIREKQALSAVGQPIIMNGYCKNFQKRKMSASQILLTRDDFENRAKYINLRNTFNELLRRNITPIVNENDTTAIEEINFGDNDALAALTAAAISADILILCTDVDGLYDGKPPKAALIKRVEKIKDEILDYASSASSSGKGSGGMKTKILAAKTATESGIDMLIVNSAKHRSLKEIILSKNGGTYFPAQKKKLSAKRSWIAFGKKPKGIIFIDKKAADMLVTEGKSLLAAGIVGVCGNFKRGETIAISEDENKREIARGLANFDSETMLKIKGKKSWEIKDVSPHIKEEAVHRDNMVILD